MQNHHPHIVKGLIILLFLLIWSACQPISWTLSKECATNANLAQLHPELWQDILRTSPYPNETRGCLRIFAPNTKESTTTLVALTQDGQIRPIDLETGNSKATSISQLLPTGLQETNWQLTLYLFGEPYLTKTTAQQRTTCQDIIGTPGYTCTKRRNGTCWAAIDLEVQKADDTNPSSVGVCTVHVPNQEATTSEPSQTEPTTSEPSKLEPPTEPTNDTNQDEKRKDEPQQPDIPGQTEPPPPTDASRPEQPGPEPSRDSIPTSWTWPPSCASRTEGCLLTIAGVPLPQDSSKWDSSDGTAATVQFLQATGIALDKTERYLYIADASWAIIRKLDLTSGRITTIAGIANKPGTTDGALGTGLLSDPQYLYMDPKGVLLISMRSSLRKLLPDGSLATEASHPSWNGNWGKAAVDASGKIYIPMVLRKTIFGIKSGGLDPIMGTGGAPGYNDGPKNLARFKSPESLAYDKANKQILVADGLNHKIRTINESTLEVGSLTGKTFSSNPPGNTDGPVDKATMNYPIDLALHSNGDLYVLCKGNNAKGQQSLKLIANGTVTTIAGTGIPDTSTPRKPPIDGPAKTVATLVAPHSLAISTTMTVGADKRPYIFISDGNYIRLYIPPNTSRPPTREAFRTEIGSLDAGVAPAPAP